MKWPYRLRLVIAALLAGAVVWWAVTPREPSYAGKPLSRWIREIKAGPDSPSRWTLSPIQSEAIQAMGMEALPGLVQAIRPEDYEPWWRAAYRWCHARLPLVLSQHLPRPAPVNRDPEMFFQSQVVQNAQRLRPQSDPLLISSLRHALPEVRAVAAQALGVVRGLGSQTNTSPEVFSALTNCLRDPEVKVRCHVVAALSLFGPPASNAVPAMATNILLNGPQDTSKGVVYERALTALALGRIGSGAVAAIPVLQGGAAQRADSYFRVTSAVALWHIRHQPPDALPALLEEFAGYESSMKWMILNCWGEMGPGAVAAVPALVTLLHSPPIEGDGDDGYNRQLALDALRKIAPDAAAKWEGEAGKRSRE